VCSASFDINFNFGTSRATLTLIDADPSRGFAAVAEATCQHFPQESNAEHSGINSSVIVCDGEKL
jgi:hypothetical protein